MEQRPGEALFRVNPEQLGWHYGYLLGFGSAIRIEQPGWLRERLAQVAMEWAEHLRNG